MKKLLFLFLCLFFTFVSSVSAQSSGSIISPNTSTSRYSECQTDADILLVIGDLYYHELSSQLATWASEIQKTRPLTTEELNQFTQIKMKLLSEYSEPSDKTRAICDAMMDTFHKNK